MNGNSDYDIKAIGRFGVLGGCVLGPSLYGGYHILDRLLPSSTRRAIAIKVAADIFGLGKYFPYSVFLT